VRDIMVAIPSYDENIHAITPLAYDNAKDEARTNGWNIHLFMRLGKR
jgi:hypothetical protein